MPPLNSSLRRTSLLGLLLMLVHKVLTQSCELSIQKRCVDKEVQGICTCASASRMYLRDGSTNVDLSASSEAIDRVNGIFVFTNLGQLPPGQYIAYCVADIPTPDGMGIVTIEGDQTITWNQNECAAGSTVATSDVATPTPSASTVKTGGFQTPMLTPTTTSVVSSLTTMNFPTSLPTVPGTDISPGSNGTRIGLYIAIVVGVILTLIVAVIVTVGACIYMRKKKSKSRDNDCESSHIPPTTTSEPPISTGNSCRDIQANDESILNQTNGSLQEDCSPKRGDTITLVPGSGTTVYSRSINKTTPSRSHTDGDVSQSKQGDSQTGRGTSYSRGQEAIELKASDEMPEDRSCK